MSSLLYWGNPNPIFVSCEPFSKTSKGVFASTRIFILGSIGLVFYPICIFFLIVGFLLVFNKPIRTSKAIVFLSIAWISVFVLILQLATSKNIDSGFVEYIITTFKYNITAGGVLFGTLLYPIYFLTHNQQEKYFLYYLFP